MSTQEQKQQMKERKQFEDQFQPLYKLVHQKKSGFKEKEAIFYNENKITIFRGADFSKFIWKNRQRVQQLFPRKVQEIEIEKESDADEVGRILLENKIIFRLDRNPDEPVKRWPRKTILTKNQTFENSKDSFYTWNIKPQSGLTSVKIGLILFVLFAAFLYPIWPFEVKYAVFKISLYFTVALLVFLLFRLSVWIVFRLFGLSFWIFPNLDDETLGFWASWKPVYSFERAYDGKLEILIRIIGIIGFAFLIWQLAQEPEVINDFTDASSQTIDDILDWGKTKIEGKVEPLHKRAIPDLSQILKEAEEAEKQQNQQQQQQEPQEQQTTSETDQENENESDQSNQHDSGEVHKESTENNDNDL